MVNLESYPDQIVLYGAQWCPDCKRAKQFFGDQRIPFHYVDIENDPDAQEYVAQVNGGMHRIPTIVFPDESIMVEPSNAELAAKLGLKTRARHTFYDTIIIGGGPTGLTAALYLAREKIETLVIERGGLGGQIGATMTLDNFPGFDEGISGPEFAQRLTRQAHRFGVEILQAQEAVQIKERDEYLCICTSDGTEYAARAILLATGARYRKLGIPGEDELIGINVHFCATCDGAFYKGKKVLVVGGGNSGFEEGLFLTRFASQVDIVEFLPEVKASQILQEKVAEQPNMKVTVNHVIQELRGKKKLEAILVKDRATNELKEWHYDGVFVFIGLSPNNELAQGKAQVDPWGFIITDRTMMTSFPGLFAAGDVRSGSTKQAASAAGEGVTAALMIRQYLKEGQTVSSTH
jgi:thioredoxin reductase (NADPH)